MTTIYILELENGKYYVGKTNNINLRYQQHVNGEGSSYTKKYKPIKILKIIDNASNFDEDKHVKEMMSEKGINNVRGGTYANEYLTDEQYNLLKKEIWGSKNLCIRCGRSGHFIKNCYAKKDINNYLIDPEQDPEQEPEKLTFLEQVTKGFIESFEKCERCGRKNHNAKDCYAQYYENGQKINDVKKENCVIS